MNEPYRLRYTNQLVGTFLLAVFILTTVVAILFLSRLFIARKTYFLTASEDQASQLRNGTEVMLLGQTIGQVSSLRYIPESEDVSVEIQVETEYADQLTPMSEVRLNRRFGIGVPVLMISRGRGRKSLESPMPDGSSLGTIRSADDPIEKMAGELEATSGSIDRAAIKLTDSLAERFDPAAERTGRAFDAVEKLSDETRPELIATLKQIRLSTERVEEQFRQLSNRIDRLVDDEIREAVVQLRQSATAAKGAAENVGQTAGTVQSETQKSSEQIARTLETLRETAVLIQQLTSETRQVVSIVRREAEELPGTTRRINETATDAQELVGDIQNHWLLRRSRGQRAPTNQVPPSSIRPGGVR
ncbi:MAG: MlaD family protein [Planctomycetota bacterium]